MIRKLGEGDRAAATLFLIQRPTLNLYMLSNMEQLGFDSAICEFWGDFEDHAGGALRAVLNRYMAGWSIYGDHAASWRALAAVVESHEAGASRLQDNPGGVPSFVPYLHGYQALKTDEEELMALDAVDFRPSVHPHGWDIRRATFDDLDQLCDLYAEAGSMSRSREGVARPLHDLRIWVAMHDDAVRSAALTNAELATAAMIGGVYTVPESRNMGLSQAVCSALCQELLSEGKQPVLYWREPSAGAVYRRLGFHACGIWRSVWLRGR